MKTIAIATGLSILLIFTVAALLPDAPADAGVNKASVEDLDTFTNNYSAIRNDPVLLKPAIEDMLEQLKMHEKHYGERPMPQWSLTEFCDMIYNTPCP